MKLKHLFDKPKNKKLAKQISIKSPVRFKESIKKVKKGGITTEEFKALNLAQTRAKMQLRRKNLSSKERDEFMKISKIKIPNVTRK